MYCTLHRIQNVSIGCYVGMFVGVMSMPLPVGFIRSLLWYDMTMRINQGLIFNPYSLDTALVEVTRNFAISAINGSSAN